MDDTGIIELHQTDENKWKAKYQGNYGIYTIKITSDGKKATNFSCTCPSDYYPCKHISIIEDAIARELAFYERQEKRFCGLRLEDCLKNAPAEKLRDFILAQAKINSNLFNNAWLEFAEYGDSKKQNKYSAIIQRILAEAEHAEKDSYYDDEYEEEFTEIEALDKWLKKIWDYIDAKNYSEALLVCKAIIEEYCQWQSDFGINSSMNYSPDYETISFDIIEEVINHINKKELLEYCLAEMKKKKYFGTQSYECFNRLLECLTAASEPEIFIALQDELLDMVTDKSSREAKIILERKIDFFKRLGQEDNVWAVKEENLQIESFREEVLKKKIEKRDFATAKKLIYDAIEKQKKDADDKSGSRIPANQLQYTNWKELLLDIAMKENDKKAMQELAYDFIQKGFEEKSYRIYKSAFNSAEWNIEKEKLFLHYSKGKFFNRSAADFLEAENDIEKLLKYIEKHLSMDELENYYKVFASSYPEKTLELFKNVLVTFAENNTGRSCYERIISLLRKMSRIKGGRNAALNLAVDFKTRYKNRRLMIEMLESIV